MCPSLIIIISELEVRLLNKQHNANGCPLISLVILSLIWVSAAQTAPPPKGIQLGLAQTKGGSCDRNRRLGATWQTMGLMTCVLLCKVSILGEQGLHEFWKDYEFLSEM